MKDNNVRLDITRAANWLDLSSLLFSSTVVQVNCTMKLYSRYIHYIPTYNHNVTRISIVQVTMTITTTV